MTGIEKFAGDRGVSVTGCVLTPAQWYLVILFCLFLILIIFCIKSIEVRMYELRLYLTPWFETISY